MPLSGIPSSTNIYNKTQPTIDIMNKILDFILKNADYRDMIALASEKECQKWIILTESELNKQFTRLRVQPEQKDGVFYLRKIQGLKEFKPNNGCILLSAFFIRLFQVVGALSLSIMDTKIPDRKDYLYYEEKKSTLIQKGVPPFLKSEPEQKKFLGLFGGVLSDIELKSAAPILQVFSLHLTSNGDGSYSLSKYAIKDRTPKPENVNGYKILIEKGNKLLFKYSLGTNSLEFTLEFEENSKFKINLQKRKGNDFPYPVQSYKYRPSSVINNTIEVLNDENKYVDFTEFIKSFTEKINNLPSSQTIRYLDELNYLEASKTYYRKLKGIEFGEESGIFLNSEKDYYSPEPLFIFAINLKNDTARYRLFLSFKLVIVKSKQKGLDAYTVQLVEPLEITGSTSPFFKNMKFQFEELENSNNENSDEDIDSDTILERTFTIKTGIGKISSEPTNRRQTIIQWLQSMFDKIKEEADEIVKSGNIKRKEGYLRPFKNSNTSEPRFKTEELWNNLVRSPPIKSFCTARALQLLNISGLQKILPETIRPLIFDTRFDLVVNGSLPIPGKSITTAAGIKALSSLYEDFNDLYDSKPKSTNNKIPLGKIIIDSFIENDKLKEGIEILDSINEESGKPVKPFDVKTSKSKVAALRYQARLLFQAQFEHTAKVNKLLEKIFVFSEPITLQPNILAKGIKGIEEVAAEARDLLTEYYSKCQIEYNKGVKILVAPAPGPAVAKA